MDIAQVQTLLTAVALVLIPIGFGGAGFAICKGYNGTNCYPVQRYPGAYAPYDFTPINSIVLVKDVGAPSVLVERLGIVGLAGSIACGQVRWATFGSIDRANAQPHEVRCKAHLYGAHNGNVTNCDDLKTWLQSEGHDVVIASRYREGSRAVGVPLLRRVMSTGASWLFRTVFPIHGVRDYTCGYRAYRAQVLKDAIARYGDQFFDQDGFQCMVDILLKLSRMHLIFGEVPFILRYDYKEGSSKMNVGKTVRDTLGLMWKRRLGG